MLDREKDLMTKRNLCISLSQNFLPLSISLKIPSTITSQLVTCVIKYIAIIPETPGPLDQLALSVNYFTVVVFVVRIKRAELIR